MDLIQKKCVPCEGGVPVLSLEEVEKFLLEVPGWQAESNIKICKDLKFKDFQEAMDFVNRVAELAEQENHHPDISVYGWNKVRFDLTTHAIKGLSENDFILAAKINRILGEN